MTNAGVLIRVSTARQGAEGVSTETQRQDCLAYCERAGWTVAMVEEDHATGTNFNRAGFQKLAEAAQRGEIEKVVVYSLDRFGRDQLGARMALQGLAQSGAELHTVAGVVKDDLLFTIISRVAEYQSEQTSEKVTRNMLARAQSGHWQAPPPFGYDIGPCPVTCGKPRALDGLVYCGCGAKCYPVPGGRKGSYIYRYVCSVRQRFGACPEQPVAYQTVADALDAELERFPSLSADHRDIRHRLLALVEPDINRLLKRSDTVRKKMEADIEKLERQ